MAFSRDRNRTKENMGYGRLFDLQESFGVHPCHLNDSMF